MRCPESIRSGLIRLRLYEISGYSEKRLTFDPSVSYYLAIVNDPRLTGKTVKIRRGPAAVTGDKSRNEATVRMDGKAR